MNYLNFLEDIKKKFREIIEYDDSQKIEILNEIKNKTNQLIAFYGLILKKYRQTITIQIRWRRQK
jgi:hypothetical protein